MLPRRHIVNQIIGFENDISEDPHFGVSFLDEEWKIARIVSVDISNNFARNQHVLLVEVNVEISVFRLYFHLKMECLTALVVFILDLLPQDIARHVHFALFYISYRIADFILIEVFAPEIVVEEK